MTLHHDIFPIRYTQSSLSDEIKKEFASVKNDVQKYRKQIEKYRSNRLTGHNYYDYNLEMAFSENPTILVNIVYRAYYYKVYHYQKLGLFRRDDATIFKVKKSDLSPEILYELDLLDENSVLKQAVSRIFEDINFDLYHDSISSDLRVVLVVD